MIVLVSKVLLRRGLEIELPGAPISTVPLRLAEGLDVGELGYATDTGRLFIGHEPRINDPHYRRAVRPYQNLEVLTEFSPRVRELIGDAARDQTIQDFFAPVTVITGASVPTITADDGNMIPTRYYGDAVSVLVEYHALEKTNGYPVKQGLLRVIASDATQMVADNECVGDSGLVFGITEGADARGHYYQLTCDNQTGKELDLYLRRTVITGLSADITTP